MKKSAEHIYEIPDSVYKNNHGSVLPMVLVFAIMGLILATIYITGQSSLVKPSYKEKFALQALLNARSGVWWTLDTIQAHRDSLHGKDTLDPRDSTNLNLTPLDPRSALPPSGFNSDMFENDTGTGLLTDVQDVLFADDEPVKADIYSVEELGVCSIQVKTLGGVKELLSRGWYREASKECLVTLGGKTYVDTDTLLFLTNPIIPNPPTRPIGEFDIKREAIDNAELDALISFYSNALSVTDTAPDELGAPLVEPPLTIQANDEFEELGESINSPLFIDGSYWDLQWNGHNKSITIFGDLQFTGTVQIQNVTFIVAGEVKVFDEAQLKNVTFFSQGAIFIGDRAVFDGNIISMGGITVYGESTIANKSMLIATGLSQRPAAPTGASSTGGPGADEGTDTGTSPQKPGANPNASPYAIQILEYAKVDGTLIAMGKAGSIKTDLETEITGVIYALKMLEHAGTLYGVAKCQELAGNQIQSNPFAFKPLPSIEEYPIPFFIGKPRIIEWIEN